jgi:DHA1 family tetracycline resistance protein-like MFS transporter
LCLVGEVGGTIWVLYGEHKFAWDSFTVGLSLTGFGIFHAVAQAFIVGPVSARWGERRTFVAGILADAAAYILIAFATKGWMAFALLPVFCLGGLGGPALQSIVTAQVGQDHQGRIQGVLSSATSFAAILGPVAISSLYFATRDVFPGAVWIAGALLYLCCLPAIARMRAKRATA